MASKRLRYSSIYLSSTLAIILGTALSASAIEFGPLKVGGAMRANYILGDYQKNDTGAPQRGGNGGNFEFDTFRINLDFEYEGWIGKGEYRWYDGYNFLHTGWLGYESDDFGRLELGLTRTPFGVAPLGPANNFFLDQHFYLGLSDAMKLGATYTRSFDRLTLDLGYYPVDVWNGNGSSGKSSRYSYAVVNEDVNEIPGAYKQRHQFNIRTTYELEELYTTFGASAQWSTLDASSDEAHDSNAYAASLHSQSAYEDFELMLQLTRFEFDANYKTGADGIRPPNSLINMGSYDFAWPAATRGWVPSVALSYTIRPEIDWIDSITFYNDYSIIIKDGEMDGKDFNNSSMNVTGMMIAHGNWFIYVDYALSDGNYFVGDKKDVYADTYAESSVGDFGANRNNHWAGRFNINFGYYF